MSYQYKMSHTGVNEPARQALGITRDEYALCAYAQFRGADPRSKKPGWCDDMKEEVSGFIGITRPGLYKMLDRMSEKGLIDIDAATGFFRITAAWMDALGVNKVDNSKKGRVNLVDTDCKLSLQSGVNLVTPNTKVKKDNSKIEGLKENAPASGENFTTVKTKPSNDLDTAAAGGAPANTDQRLDQTPTYTGAAKDTDPVNWAADRIMYFAIQNKETVKGWYEQKFVQPPANVAALRREVEVFISHFMGVSQYEFSALNTPVDFFKRRYTNWIETGKRLKKDAETKSPTNNLADVSRMPVRR